jgi:16S rRNA (guanine1207-N2)-methyltransferase
VAEAVLYGAPPPGLVEVPAGARQVSPLVPGSGTLEEAADVSLDAAVVVAPPGTLERAFVLAHALRALKPGAALTVLAPKDKGGTRLRKGLEAFGCVVDDEARRHHRICRARRPAAPAGLDAAIAAGAPRFVEALGLWTQPGVFAWDRIDPGSALLLAHLPPLAGRVADFGCGVGVLARGVLASPAVSRLTLIDLDRRAVDCARRNLDDGRAEVVWADVRRAPASLEGLDAVVMNPPFHDGGREDRDLGAAFIAAAAQALRKGGRCWLVANRHLPYEAPLKAAFAAADLKAETGGYKLYEARK